MRLNKKIKFVFLLFVILFLKGISTVNACDCGELCEHCTTKTWETSAIDFGCEEDEAVVIDCQDQTDGAGGYEEGTTGTYWSPGGYENVTCTNSCDPDGDANIITECYEYIGDCPDPGGASPTPTDGGGGSDPTPPPEAPTLSSITGTIQEDNGAAFSGNICTQATNNPLSLTHLSITTGAYSAHFSSFIPGFYTLNTSTTGNNYTVTLDLSNQTGLVEYVCSCPAALDPNNPYVCQYTGVSSPLDNVNFYLQINNLSNESWFQVFGGNVFGRNGIASIIPYSFCDETNDCQPALTAPRPLSTNLLSSGFPIANTGNGGAVRSYDYSTAYHSYFHLPEKTSNLNSYDVDTDLNQLSYDYFYKLAENQVQEIGNGEDLEPLFTDWTSSTWWNWGDVNYVKVNGNVNIDETQGFTLIDGQKLVVFVDGNLILDDSDPHDSAMYKITNVDTDSFLAFFVNGDIIITADVGYELDPLNPSTPPVSHDTSNLEGVFVADNNLIIQSKTAVGEVPPDKKFIGSGTFVGWNNVLLNRTFSDNNLGPILSNSQAVENFIYRPDLLANWPVKLKASTSNWREVDPQFINY